MEYRNINACEPKDRMPNSIDSFIIKLDEGLRNIHLKPKCDRPSPSAKCDEGFAQNDVEQRKLAASLMRINHVGEVCAQALYQGQALTSRSETVKRKMQEAANEEIDHLNWCHERIEELDDHLSYLNPLWYAGSLGIGVAAGLAGDKWSLGFLAETEHQVAEHLRSHLEKLPESDKKSRAIIEQMIIDETKHADMAIAEGANELPDAVKTAMRSIAKIMTAVAAKI